jgi:arabinan endo-1,5-alpha-L-arabinosidase
MPYSVSRLLALFPLISLLLLNACAARPGLSYSPTAATQLRAYPLMGDTNMVHDPSFIKQRGIYYAFASGGWGQTGLSLPIRCSSDAVVWTACGGVFHQPPQWLQDRVPGVSDLWAPDVAFFNGVYHVYYAGSTGGSQRSAIGLVTNTTLDPADPTYKWVDRGEVIGSVPGDDFNAIDPNILVDTDGSVWMTYGSFWSGIKQMQLDPQTGLVMSGATRHDLATRPGVQNDPIEGASLVHAGQFYYLFVSVDYCCNANPATSDYKEAMGRSTSPHGPFVDVAGTPMLEGGGTVLLEGNGTWNAPGGGTVHRDATTGESTLVVHALNMQQGGTPYLWVKNIDWSTGWPVLTQ